MDYRSIQKLKAFFSALKDSGFKQNLKQIPSFALVDGQRTPVDKPFCLQLLRSFPQFQGDKFKDDNAIVKYLSDPNNRKFLLGNFTREQQIELTKALEEKPITVEAVSEQPSGQGEPLPAGEPPATMTGGVPFPGMAAGGAAATPRKVIYKVPRAEVPEEPKSKLYVANKSGRIVEERTITPTSVTVNKPETPSKIAIADKSGAVVGERSIGGEAIKSPAQSKIFIANKSGTVVGEHTIPSSKRFNFRGFKMPTAFTNAAKNFGSRAGILLNRNIIPIARTGLGAFAGGVLTGGNLLGMLGGGIGGATFNAWGKKVLNGSLNSFEKLSNPLSRGKLSSGLKKGFGTGKKVAMALGLFGLFFGFSLIAGIGSSTTPTGQAAPLSAADLNSCQFSRSGTSASYKSNLLLGYISEASNLTGIPPAILAAFIRVESPSAVNMSDDQIKNYAATCNERVSSTGALGIMQIQPPGTTSARGDPASCDDCIDAGARLLGKTVQSMTRDDYCDPRTSIIVGAGWILKKMNNLGYANSGKWNPAWTNDRKAIDALVNTYYGCLQYGGPTECTGPFNYGADVYNGAQNCKASGLNPIAPGSIGFSLSCPVPNSKITCGTAANPVNECGHGKDGYTLRCDPVKYACDTSSTRYPEGTYERYSAALYKAIDVRPQKTNEIVSLPFINGTESVEWQLIRGPEPIAGGTWGYKAIYTATYQGRVLTLDLTHIKDFSARSKKKSGDSVSTVFTGIGHLHTGIAADGTWVEAEKEANMCSR